MNRQKSAAMALMIMVGVLAAPAAALACRLNAGDRVWNDANRNGVQDPGESGINGVRVTISPGYYTDRLDPNSYVDSVTTHTGPQDFGDGFFMFYPIHCDVTYSIAVDLSTVPAGMIASAVGAGADRTVDSDDPQGTEVLLPVTGFDYGDTTIDFGFFAPAPSAGVGTPRFWKHNPELWPVDSLTIGNVQSSKNQVLHLLRKAHGEKTITMFRQLVAAKLNILSGADGSCIADDVTAGDQWMMTYSRSRKGVQHKSAAWRNGRPIAQQLRAYNRGQLCAPAVQ